MPTFIKKVMFVFYKLWLVIWEYEVVKTQAGYLLRSKVRLRDGDWGLVTPEAFVRTLSWGWKTTTCQFITIRDYIAGERMYNITEDIQVRFSAFLYEYLDTHYGKGEIIAYNGPLVHLATMCNEYALRPSPLTGR